MKIENIDKYSDLYPETLRNINDAPEILYCLGDCSLLKQDCIAIVGTRRSSPYGRWAAYEISKKIAAAGECIVSGMAEGIDSQAHLGALDSKGKTIAVLGCGVNVCFPKSNEKLYKRIIENGLIVSEYLPDEPARNYYFPQRNRIISGLSNSVIVVEGALKSGSMITANLALNQGKDVFAVPGNINQPNSVGVNTLIRDGAMPILSLEDIYPTLGIKNRKLECIKEQCTEDEALIIDCVKYQPGISVEEIALSCDFSINEANVLICGLEIKSLLRREGGYIYLCIK